MNAIKHGIRIGAVVAAFLIGYAEADYSPMIQNSEWVYKGVGDIEPTWGVPLRYGPILIRYKEELRLKLMSTVAKKDTLIHTIREQDSLFARVARKKTAWGYDTTIGNLPDTVAVRTLTYKEYGGKFHLLKGDSLQFGHADSADLFFYTRTTVPYSVSPLTGLAPPYSAGLQSRMQFNGQQPDDRQAWYLDRVGLYWAKLGVSCSMCGCLGTRELLLATYRGMAIDPGIDPPGAGLAKEGRIACALRKTDRVGFLRFASVWGGGSMNALGRTIPAISATRAR